MPLHHHFLRRSFEFFGTQSSGTTVLVVVASDNAFARSQIWLLRDARVAVSADCEATHRPAILCPLNPLCAEVQPRAVHHLPGPSTA